MSATNQISKMCTAALDYASHGHKVFPVYGKDESTGNCACDKGVNCTEPAKHPITLSGFRSATTDTEIIEAWWKKDPNANIGRPTEDVVVIDADVKDADGNKTLHDKGIPEGAPVVRSGSGGRHVYCTKPGDLDIKSAAKPYPHRLPGIDLRAQGGYVILPPSENLDGPYTWEVPLSEHLPEIPCWLREAIQESEAERASASSYGERAQFDFVKALNGVPEGERDDTIFKYACSLQARNTPIEEAKILVLHGAGNCNPPFDPHTALEKVDRAYRRYKQATTGTPTFPVEALPEPCRRLALEASEAIGCSSDLIAVPMLAVLASAVGNTRVVRVKAGWDEPLNIYAVTVTPPGGGKSPGQKVATAPVRKAQVKAKDTYDRAKMNYELLDKDEKAKTRKPILKSTYTDDATVEALAAVMEVNQRGVLSSRDELAALVLGMNQYKAKGKGADRQFYQSTWSGVPIKVDRKLAEEPLIIPRPYLSITGGIQPDLLPDLAAGRDDGFADRFLFAYPGSTPIRWSDAEISDKAWSGYYTLYESLSYLSDMKKPSPSPSEPVPVRFTAEAQTLFSEQFDRLHVESEAEGFPARLKGVWSKLVSYLARFSCLLALCRARQEAWRSVDGLTVDAFSIDFSPDSEECHNVQEVYILPIYVTNATKIIEYFKGMSHKVYGRVNDQHHNDALTTELEAFLEESGGYWEGEPSDLLDDLKDFGCDALPDTPEALGKSVRRICRHNPTLSLQTHRKKNEAGQVRRRLEITVNPSAVN